MRGVILIVLAVFITASAALFLFHREEVGEIVGNKASVGGLEKTMPLSELETRGDTYTAPTSPPLAPPLLGKERGEGGRGSEQNVDAQVELADKYLEESLPLLDPKQRFVLIEKINGFKGSYKLAINSTGSDPVELIRATARYIAVWSPFYYYIHPDAQRVLGPIIKMLEYERVKMLAEFAKKDARRAGQLAAEDIEYYIEDIRKSAARRNSDFIVFSIQDYERYRTTFDDFAQMYPDFLFGFAQSAHILSDDFYRMHEEVDMEYSDKTRKKVEDMRLELRELHKQALRTFKEADREGARKALRETIGAIEIELSGHPDWRAEIHDIMKSDYEFYKGIIF